MPVSLCGCCAFCIESTVYFSEWKRNEKTTSCTVACSSLYKLQVPVSSVHWLIRVNFQFQRTKRFVEFIRVF